MRDSLKTYYVYSLTNPNNGEVFYVGCSATPLKRYSMHRVYNPKKGTHRKLPLFTKKDKYIIKNKIVPVFNILDQVKGTKEDANLLEAVWIRSFAKKSNSLTNGAHNFRSYLPTKAKIRTDIVKVIYK